MNRPDEPYVVMTVECIHCKTKQKVHVAVHVGPGSMPNHSVACIQCNRHFVVTIPDKVLRGPFVGTRCVARSGSLVFGIESPPYGGTCQ